MTTANYMAIKAQEATFQDIEDKVQYVFNQLKSYYTANQLKSNAAKIETSIIYLRNKEKKTEN